jgi:hypothetical protein
MQIEAIRILIGKSLPSTLRLLASFVCKTPFRPVQIKEAIRSREIVFVDIFPQSNDPFADAIADNNEVRGEGSVLWRVPESGWNGWPKQGRQILTRRGWYFCEASLSSDFCGFRLH